MNSKSAEQNIIEDYADFMNTPQLNPPAELNTKIISYVRSKLDPNGWLVFSKLSLLHLAGGLITLSFCPQFGVNVLGNDVGITKYMFKLGPYGCTIACGALFIGVTVLLASTFLSQEEILKIKKFWPLQLLAIALLSLGSFIMLDADILISFGAAWIFGGLMGGLAMLETGIFLRKTAASFA